MSNCRCGVSVDIPVMPGVTVPLPALPGVCAPVPCGPPGVDGYSPSASVERNTEGAIITITDKAGTTQAQIYDGDVSRAEWLYAFPTDTASGAVAFFPDGADGLPVAELTVSMVPVQNLNGYDSPWPAGGGANIFDAQAWAILENNDKYYTVNEDESITIFANDVGGLQGRFINVSPSEEYSILSTFANSVRIFNSGSQTVLQSKAGTFTAPTDGKIAIKFYSSTYPTTGNFILVKGSTVPSSWTPYSNICPISGRTGLTVYHSGADTTSPESVSVSWESEAGTVYAGTLEVSSGVLTVTAAFLSTTWGALTTSSLVPAPGFVIRSADIRSNPANVAEWPRAVCNIAAYDATIERESVHFSFQNAGNYIYFTMPEGLADETVIHVAYPVTSLQTFQLTAEEVSTLLGANSIWTDAGDTAVTYRADPTLYINKRLQAQGG